MCYEKHMLDHALNVIEPLTVREYEVLRLAAYGLTNKAIARQLVIVERTVQCHLTAVFGKLGVETRLQAVILSLFYGLLDLTEIVVHHDAPE
jgi:DNA-binding NarL/FixJ family response regulator